jgi:hypothetical protein
MGFPSLSAHGDAVVQRGKRTGFFFRGNSKKCVVIDQRKTTNYLFFQPVLNFHSVIYVDVLFVQIQFFTGIYILEKALDGYKDESEI